MSIIKLNATDSTNTYLKSLALSQVLDDFTIVSADLQHKGRGQMGAEWVSDKGKNLTISILKKLDAFHITNQFDLNCLVSLAIYGVLYEMKVPNLSIKWPNDILSGNQKICGILIESVIQRSKLNAMIIGVGLNVNQTQWQGLPRATSIKKETGIHFDLEEILTMLLHQFHHYVQLLLDGKFDEIKNAYEACLFKKDKPATFITNNKQHFVGIIKGVTNSGKLILLEEDNVINEYDLKQIQLLY